MSYHLCSTVQPFTASIKKETIAHSNLVLTLERSFNFHTLANPLYPMELAQIALLLLGLSFRCEKPSYLSAGEPHTPVMFRL